VTTTALDNIIKRMGKSELVLPYFENAMRSQEYRPYYGKGDGYFHPSTHPLMGERELYYRFHPDTCNTIMEEPFSLQREMTVSVGHTMHEILQTMLAKTGLLREENVEKLFTIEEHHVRGKIDAIVDHPRLGPLVVEIKTRTHYKFAKTTEPLPEWEAQLSIQLDSQGLERGLILMVETGYPFRLSELQVRRNDALLSQIYGKFDRVREAIALNRPPAPCCAPNSAEVTSCPARFNCWMNPDPTKRPR
jgi:hypothetical protein